LAWFDDLVGVAIRIIERGAVVSFRWHVMPSLFFLNALFFIAI